MHAVKLGQPAGDYYPVISGLVEGQSVVTVGGFLVDAENRLNPSNIDAPAMDEGEDTSGHDHHESAPGGGSMGGMKM